MISLKPVTHTSWFQRISHLLHKIIIASQNRPPWICEDQSSPLWPGSILDTRQIKPQWGKPCSFWSCYNCNNYDPVGTQIHELYSVGALLFIAQNGFLWLEVPSQSLDTFPLATYIVDKIYFVNKSSKGLTLTSLVGETGELAVSVEYPVRQNMAKKYRHYKIGLWLAQER